MAMLLRKKRQWHDEFRNAISCDTVNSRLKRCLPRFNAYLDKLKEDREDGLFASVYNFAVCFATSIKCKIRYGYKYFYADSDEIVVLKKLRVFQSYEKETIENLLLRK